MVGSFYLEFLTQRRRDAEYAEVFWAACGSSQGLGARSQGVSSWSSKLELESGIVTILFKAFNAYPPSAKRESAKRMP